MPQIRTLCLFTELGVIETGEPEPKRVINVA